MIKKIKSEYNFTLFNKFMCLGVMGTVHLILVIDVWNMVAISSNFRDYIKKKLNKLA
jgi:hypothetical protein